MSLVLPSMESLSYLSSSPLLSCHFPPGFLIHSHTNAPVLPFPLSSHSQLPLLLLLLHPSIHPFAPPLWPSITQASALSFAWKLDNRIQVQNVGRRKRGIKRTKEELKVKDVCLFGHSLTVECANTTERRTEGSIRSRKRPLSTRF